MTAIRTTTRQPDPIVEGSRAARGILIGVAWGLVLWAAIIIAVLAVVDVL